MDRACQGLHNLHLESAVELLLEGSDATFFFSLNANLMIRQSARTVWLKNSNHLYYVCLTPSTYRFAMDRNLYAATEGASLDNPVEGAIPRTIGRFKNLRNCKSQHCANLRKNNIHVVNLLCLLYNITTPDTRTVCLLHGMQLSSTPLPPHPHPALSAHHFNAFNYLMHDN